MAAAFEISPELIASENRRHEAALAEDYEHLGKVLRRRGLDVDALTARAAAFRVAVPSWGVGTGGTRFARFPGAGEPRDIFDKLDDCATVFRLVRATPAVSLHIPWDRTEDLQVLNEHARARGLHFDAMNSNTFQDPGRPAPVVQVRQPDTSRRRGAAAGDRAQPGVHSHRRGARLVGALRLDRRRQQLPWTGARPPCAPAVYRELREHPRGAAAGLADLHSSTSCTSPRSTRR